MACSSNKPGSSAQLASTLPTLPCCAHFDHAYPTLIAASPSPLPHNPFYPTPPHPPRKSVVAAFMPSRLPVSSSTTLTTSGSLAMRS